MRQADSLMVIFVKEARATDIVANWMRKKLVGAGRPRPKVARGWHYVVCSCFSGMSNNPKEPFDLKDTRGT